MSGNDELPLSVENAIRKLRNNDAFLAQVWSLLKAYKDIREQEKNAPLLEDMKDSVDDVLESLDAYSKAVKSASQYGYGDWSRLEKYRDEIEAYWSASREGLERRDGRITKQESLTWLTRVLGDVFATWRIPENKLSGFIYSAISPILPEGTAPSRSSIQTAVKEYRN